MTPERQHLQHAQQLLRLRELRRTQAEAEARRARQAQADALVAMQAAQAVVAQQQHERRVLLDHFSHGALLPRWAPQAQARREWLEDRLERAEYALIDEEESLHDCDRQLDHAGAALRAAWARNNAAEQALQQARRQCLAAAERRAEREDPPALSLPPGVPR